MVDYLPILTMAILGFLFIVLSFVASSLLAPQRTNKAKTAPYECGIVPESEPVDRFPVKFYLVAMAFIVLDVEIIFIYPFTTVFRGLSLFGVVIMSVFLLVLLVPFAYLLSTGALAWGPLKRFGVFAGGPVLRSKTASGVKSAPPSTEEEAA